MKHSKYPATPKHLTHMVLHREAGTIIWILILQIRKLRLMTAKGTKFQ